MKKFFFFLFILTAFSLFSQTNSQEIERYLLQADKYARQSRFDSSFYFLDLAENLNKEIQNPEYEINILLARSDIYLYLNKTDTAKVFLRKAIKIANSENINAATEIYLKLSTIFTSQGMTDSAVYILEKTEKIVKKDTSQESFLAEIYNNLGVIYKKIGEFQLALENFQKALPYAEKYNKNNLYINILNNISLIHQKQENYQTALKYLQEAIDYAKDKKMDLFVALLDINIGHLLINMDSTLKAYPYIDEAVKMLENTDNIGYYVHALALKGDYFKKLKKFDEARQTYEKVLELNTQVNDPSIKIRTLIDLAEINFSLGDSLEITEYLLKAKNYCLEGVQMAEQMEELAYLNRYYGLLAKIYAKINDYKTAYMYSQKFVETNKKLFNEEKSKAIEEMEAKYENQKKQQEIERQKLLLKQAKIMRIALSLGIVLVLAIALISFTNYRRKKRDNEIITKQNAELQQANEEIIAQRDLLQEQKEKIEEIHKRLMDSISYAKRIQTAAMPAPALLKNLFKDYFIVFKPLQTVSGDFYWAKKIKNYVVFTVADCTGHGVPGAFVSMLGISMLNEITQQEQITSTSEVLEKLRENIKIALNQLSDNPEQMDGMDIAICAYDTNTGILEYSGANRPMLIVSKDGTLMEYKPVKNPVAFYFNEKPFTSVQIEIKEGDIIYLFSDGLTDQFNSNGKKFTKSRLKKVLSDIKDKTPEEQQEYIDNLITEWAAGTSQIDDITIMGVILK